jgi:hypothetical protein
MTQLGPDVNYIPRRRKHVYILVAGVRLSADVLGSLSPAPDACSPIRIRQSGRMVGPPIIVSSILLVTTADAGRRVETLFWRSSLARSKSGQRLVRHTFLVTTADPSCIQEGVCSKTIDRYRSVRSICWMPGGEGKPPMFSQRYTS